MKKKHIIWLLLIVGVAGAAFYAYSVRHDAEQAQQSTDKHAATVSNTTKETDTATDKGPADMEAVAEDTAAEEAISVKETERATDENEAGPRGDVVAALAQELGVEVQAAGSVWGRDDVLVSGASRGRG